MQFLISVCFVPDISVNTGQRVNNRFKYIIYVSKALESENSQSVPQRGEQRPVSGRLQDVHDQRCFSIVRRLPRAAPEVQ